MTNASRKPWKKWRQLSAMAFVLFTGAFSANAAEILWLKLTPTFAYKDISTICSTGLAPTTLYFGAELENLQVNRAVLKDNNVDVITDKIFFLPEELSGIELYRDGMGRVWLKTLPLTARLLNWFLFNAGAGIPECKPSQPLLTVGPIPFSYSFAVEGLGEGGVSAESTFGKLFGNRKDGGAYQAELSLRASQYRAE